MFVLNQCYVCRCTRQCSLHKRCVLYMGTEPPSPTCTLMCQCPETGTLRPFNVQAQTSVRLEEVRSKNKTKTSA